MFGQDIDTKEKRYNLMKKGQLKTGSIFAVFITVIVLILCLGGCVGNTDNPSSSNGVVFYTPSTGDPQPTAGATGDTSATPTEATTGEITQAPTESSAVTSTPTPTPTPTPTKTPTPTPTATPTPTPTAAPTGSIQLSVDYEEATGDKAKYTNLAPLKQVSFTVIDPYNTRQLSNERVGHWFGPNTNQPKAFQKQYEDNGWSALTIDTKTTDAKVIYLTFDCGYENGYTEQILNALKEKNCPATFFVTLEYVLEAPELTARMIEDGHIVGNHSSNHPDFSTISRERMARELQKLDNYLRVNFGYSSRYFRYPQGAYSPNTMDLVTSIGYRAIFWSYAYNDYTQGAFPDKDEAFRLVTNRLHDGEVLLLHAISPGNAAAIGDIIDYARAQGYEFRSLDQYPW